MLEIVLPDRSRFALARELTIGRASGNTVRLIDESVSRVHARISPGPGGAAVLEDAGSSYGTWLDGRLVRSPTPLREGSRIRLGNLQLEVERLRDERESGRTIVVPEAAAATVDEG